MSIYDLCKELFYALPESLRTSFKKRYYLRAVRRFCIDDEPDQKIVKQLVRQGEHAVDLGANIGVYTRLLSELVGQDGKVVSFEPVPTTFAILSFICASLSLDNVELYNLAAGSSAGHVPMRIPGEGSGSEKFYQARVVTAADDDAAFRVRMSTVDELAGTWHPTFIKIDVEGYELEAICGSFKTIERCRPSLLVEVGDPQADGSAARVFELLQGLGYSAYWYDKEKLRARQSGDASPNFFFLQPAHLDSLRERGVTIA